MTCSSWGRTVDCAAKEATERRCPVEPFLQRPYLAHWALVSIFKPESLEVLKQALSGAEASVFTCFHHAFRGFEDRFRPFLEAKRVISALKRSI